MTHADSENRQAKAPLVKLLMATVAAGALLVAFVLPAEYGIDPTGIGAKTGISSLSGSSIKRDYGQTMAFNIEPYDLEAETINQSVRGLLQLKEQKFKRETILIEIEELGAMEHKFILAQDDTLQYSWKVVEAEGEGVFYEFHGHPSSDDAPNYPEGFEQPYSIGEGMTQSGSFTAPFPGYHGWFFVNREAGPIQIELTVSGYYSEHKEMYRAVDGKVITNVEF